MVVHEHEIDFGIIDTYFVRTNPVIDFFEHMVNCFFLRFHVFSQKYADGYHQHIKQYYSWRLSQSH